ncbi:MAG: ABC transporter permease [Ginsengibacter sp.]|jgi:ABC-type antimicrobial peptide transport system permease subunit
MFKNYFKIAWRNLRKNKTTSFINLFGLAIGMAGVILIGTWVQNELSFEQFHADNDNLYKVWNRSAGPGEIGTWDVTSGPLGKALEKDFPEVKNTSRIYWSTDRLFNYADKNIKAKGNEVDKPFLSMFTFPLLQGDPNHALDDIHSIVLTENLAKNIFGKEDPLNKIVKLDNKENYKITGVLKNLPNNTEFDFEYLISLTPDAGRFYGGESWETNTFYTYVLLQPNTNIGQFNDKIKKEIVRYSPEAQTEIFLHPMSKWHLYSRFENGKVAGGRIEIVHLLMLIGGLILLIACINFMNLSTAQSQKRAKEVGVRKVIGAGKGGLISQFLCESILVAFMAGVLALGIVQLFLPSFNQLIEKSLSINYANPLLWISLIGFVLFTGLLAGSYPAFFLSSFKPVSVLKGSFKGAQNLFNPRKILVVLQFSVAIVLVISTLVIYKQIQFVQNRDNGYNVKNLVEVPIEGDVEKNYDLIKTELINSGAVTAMSKTGFGVTLDASYGAGFNWDGMDKALENLNFSIYRSGGDFIKTMGMKLEIGRDIDFTHYPGDSSSVMINEMAVEKMGMKDPVGKIIRSGDKPLTIVGVFKDFIIGSPYKEVRPMLVRGYDKWNFNTVLRLNEHNSITKNLNTAQNIFKKYNSAYPFTYQFVDQEYAQKFKDEKQTGSLAGLFAGLTIFISCLGLFGLAAFMAENRSKEIGIRKVLGANVTGIIKLLSREFVLLVTISIGIAVPVGWWAMNKWLEDFTYRINIGWQVFAITGVMAIVIALLAVSFHAVKAAIANPVKSLRAE